jgi:hypothetical protein
MDMNEHGQETVARFLSSLSPSTESEAIPGMGRGNEGEGKKTLHTGEENRGF